MVGTPTYDGKLTMQYTHSLTQTIVLGLQQEIQFVPYFLGYEPIVSRARNIALHEFMTSSTDFDGLLWIDADVQWEPQWAIDVVNSGKDVLGIPLVVKDMSKEHYSLSMKMDNLETDENGLLSVWTMGTGFLYTSKEANAKVYEKALPFIEGDREIKWVFENEYSKEMLLGEDVIYCRKLRDEGYEVFIDTTKALWHVGAITYYGDFPKFFENVKKQIKEQKDKEKTE